MPEHDHGIKNLREELCASQIMNANYEQMLNQHQLTLQLNHQQVNQVSEQIKFEIFQAFCDNLFASFDRYVKVDDFEQISASIFNWLEEHVRPQTLRDMCLTILRDFYTSSSPDTVS